MRGPCGDEKECEVVPDGDLLLGVGDAFDHGRGSLGLIAAGFGDAVQEVIDSVDDGRDGQGMGALKVAVHRGTAQREWLGDLGDGGCNIGPLLE